MVYFVYLYSPETPTLMWSYKHAIKAGYPYTFPVRVYTYLVHVVACRCQQWNIWASWTGGAQLQSYNMIVYCIESLLLTGKHMYHICSTAFMCADKLKNITATAVTLNTQHTSECRTHKQVVWVAQTPMHTVACCNIICLCIHVLTHTWPITMCHGTRICIKMYTVYTSMQDHWPRITAWPMSRKYECVEPCWYKWLHTTHNDRVQACIYRIL